MNAKHLLILYERVAEAPDAVFHLRRFVLNLAVRGKLVEQNPEDEPVSELLKRILIAKRHLAEIDGQRKKQHLCTQMVSPPFGLPSTWSWASLGTVFQYDAGTKCDPKTLKPSAWLLELQDIEKGTGHILNRIRTGERESKSTKSQFSPGDILYGKLRPYLNKVLVADEAGYSTTEIVAIRPYLQLSSEYCALALRSPYFVEYATRLGQGTKMPRLRTKDAIVAPFPLPPLAEQHRIVEKVNELIALFDQLGEMRTAREKIRDRLTKATLTRISTPSASAALFRAHARFAIDALPALTARADQISDMRQTILNLAVHGKLVEQDPTDEPAPELLRRIATEREKLADARVIRKPKPMEKLDEPPFTIPPNWKWTRLGGLAELVRGVSFPASAKSNKPAEGLLPCLRSGNIQTSTVWDDLIYVPESVVKSAAKLIRLGDVLISIANSYALVGKCSIVDAMPYRATFGAFLAAIRFHLILPEYARLFLKSNFSSSAFRAGSSQTTNIANITFSTIRGHPFPLPPLAEQHRIVAKVNELLILCDKLEEVCCNRDNSRIQLLETLLHKALASSISESAWFESFNNETTIRHE